jgi:carnosine N-methyltransferase
MILISQLLTRLSQYGKTAHFNTTHTRRQAFYALPREHWELLAAPPFNYLGTLNIVDDALDKNAEFALAIHRAGLEAFGLQNPDPKSKDKTEASWRGKATQNDLKKARGTLRQFYRDWSAEGSREREICYGRVLKVLQTERLKSNKNLNILVPGAGLGRLVFDLCAAGFNAEGNEISYHQLLASSYILNAVKSAAAHTLYPWIHSFSNHRTRADHMKSVAIPDVHCPTALAGVKNAGEMSMSASDFLLLYGSKDQKNSFDAVACVFFLDTAPNVIRYLETIHNCLRPGGLLVNFGPLLWHFENNAPGKHGQGFKDSLGESSQGKHEEDVITNLLTLC